MLEEVLEVVGESFWEELHLVEEILEVGNLLEVHHLAEEILGEDLVDFFEEVVEILVGIPVMIIDQSMEIEMSS